MSATLTSRPLSAAVAEASEFRALFAGCTDVWEVAGSVRRKIAHVNDIEHVVIPRIQTSVDGLFGQERSANLLWNRLDELVIEGKASRALYANDSFRWGERYRGVAYGASRHEIFAASIENWGAILAIRTGPAQYSRMLVTALQGQSRRMKDGKVWDCKPCERCCDRDPKCATCDGTGLMIQAALSVPDEQTFFRLCGVAFVPPEARR